MSMQYGYPWKFHWRFLFLLDMTSAPIRTNPVVHLVSPTNICPNANVKCLAGVTNISMRYGERLLLSLSRVVWCFGSRWAQTSLAYATDTSVSCFTSKHFHFCLLWDGGVYPSLGQATKTVKKTAYVGEGVYVFVVYLWKYLYIVNPLEFNPFIEWSGLRCSTTWIKYWQNFNLWRTVPLRKSR